MKIPFFLRLPVLWAAGDASSAPPANQNQPRPDPSEGIRKYYFVLLLAAVVMICVVVRAEGQRNWHVAQACLLGALFLTAITVWCWWLERHKPPDLSVRAEVYRRALEKLLWCVAVGMFAMLSAATRQEYWQAHNVARAIGYGILIAGSAFISGVLAGYLFGLRPTDNSRNSANQSANPPQTNLVEIADWLTKIILGAGLVQLTRLPAPIWNFAQTMAEGVVKGTTEPANPPMALAIMGFFSACGLLYGYLWTRYEDAVTSYGAGDASAGALVDLWLNGHPTPSDQTRLDMIDAVEKASSTARIRIFLEAEQYRKAATEDANERSLPVFQALVDADSEGVFHRNRSQYALALMGKKKDPKTSANDWSQALSLLSDAIRIRDRSGEPAWREYEFARAVCQIKLDPNFTNDPPRASETSTAQSIRADLDQAKDVPDAAKNLIDKSQVVGKWEGLNK